MTNKKETNWDKENKKFLSEMDSLAKIFKVEKKPIGRPTIYTPELADSICDLIITGKSLNSICFSEDMPDKAQVFRWLAKYPDFRDKYALASEERTESQKEVLDDIGDNAIYESKVVDPKAANAVVAAWKLKADNLKWTMSKMKPKKYGDGLDLTSKGEKLTSGNTIVFQDFSKKDETESQ